MDKIVYILVFLTAIGMMFVTFPDGVAAVSLVFFISVPIIFLIRQTVSAEDGKVLVQIFLIGLVLRLIFGVYLHVFQMREFFGGDALTYDAYAQRILDVWMGAVPAGDPYYLRATSTGTPGWGVNYLTSFIYLVLGRNILAAQSFCAVIGAATAPMVYFCAHKIFGNKRVGTVAAVMVAVFPAFIIWSGQLLKDGLIIFLLVLAMTMVLQLQEKFNYFAVIFLLFSLFGILSLRFYIFYMVAIAVAGSFIVGQSSSVKAILRGFVLLVVCGVALTYIGVTRTATENFDKWGSLESVQRSRDDLSRSGQSGFGGDVDVSTTQGAISAVPIGLTYLMLAPFPWEMANLRQAITLPEVLVWWALLPLFVYGLLFTIKTRMRGAIPVLIFTLMLTLAYSIFQGNVGTAYRQRTQIQVFMFIFIAVGWELRKEKKENRLALRAAKRRQIDEYLKEKKEKGG
ncbi:MAG: glycosyltransferase family 39 protein [Acidobacteria bacterium]|nr:glycosyltransferase family 39 protein [Acidobacteriota bacterium]